MHNYFHHHKFSILDNIVYFLIKVLPKIYILLNLKVQVRKAKRELLFITCFTNSREKKKSTECTQFINIKMFISEA